MAELPGLPGVTGSGKSSLERHGYLVVEPDPADRRAKRVRLTPRGMQARAAYEPLLTSIEQRWRARHGDAVVGRTRAALEALLVNFENDLPHHPVPDWS